MSEAEPGGYAGDVTAREAWDDLVATEKATLVDTRTAAEWAYVGFPLLSSIGKAVVMIEWDAFPSGELVPDFVGRLKAELGKLGVGADDPVYFICRTGNRSRQAAIAATAAGYGRAFNVANGFEGRLDGERHRGGRESWKGEGLPWVQS